MWISANQQVSTDHIELLERHSQVRMYLTDKQGKQCCQTEYLLCWNFLPGVHSLSDTRLRNMFYCYSNVSPRQLRFCKWIVSARYKVSSEVHLQEHIYAKLYFKNKKTTHLSTVYQWLQCFSAKGLKAKINFQRRK